MRAKYNIAKITSSFILLEDLSNIFGSITITNDAESVVEHLYKLGLLEDRKLYYIDTDDALTGILHEKGRFVKFYFPNVTTDELIPPIVMPD